MTSKPFLQLQFLLVNLSISKLIPELPKSLCSTHELSQPVCFKHSLIIITQWEDIPLSQTGKIHVTTSLHALNNLFYMNYLQYLPHQNKYIKARLLIFTPTPNVCKFGFIPYNFQLLKSQWCKSTTTTTRILNYKFAKQT